MGSKYQDKTAIIQIIGSVLNNPKILENNKYTFSENDFPDEFHKICFGTIYNLFQLGANDITLQAIEDYLSSRPKKLAVYKDMKGAEYLLQCKENANQEAFDYYYNRIKKFSLLRGYASLGLDLKNIYDVDNIFDTKKKQDQEDFIDNCSFEDITRAIDDLIDSIKAKYASGVEDKTVSAGDGIDELLKSLKDSPSFGYPMYGKFMNTITRGARLGKMYLRSGATGLGKSRSMAADACYSGCFQMYDIKTKSWISIGRSIPTLIIGTEQDLSEYQTMFLAFIAGVNEEHILTNRYEDDEEERVAKAALILKQSKLYFEEFPDFSIEDIERCIRTNIREHDVELVFFDYIHSSMKILSEITSKSKVSIREDNILFLFSVKLKTIAVENNIFLLSSTQLNADYRDSETPDQNLLRGAKAIADSIDYGSIMLEVTNQDREKIAPICLKLGIDAKNINVKMSVYKNRGNKYRAIYVWMVADKGTCRFDPVFITDWYGEYQDVVDIKLKINDESIF